ncbi:MAG: response regulator [Actinobacteria bacterium]|nr:response regulator [Actinomycetota bacterium]
MKTSPAPTARRAPVSDVERRSETILLVEDNPDDVELTLRALRKEGLPAEVVVARDGVEALDYVFARGEHAARDPRRRPAVVLLDLKMPRMDGLEVLRRLRSDDRTRLLPVVVLTSSREECDVKDSYSLGANSYIRKPVDFDRFREAVRQLGVYWLTLNEAPPAVA